MDVGNIPNRNLLRQSARILQSAARLYTNNTNQQADKIDNYGNEPFHATLLSQLDYLLMLLDDTSHTSPGNTTLDNVLTETLHVLHTTVAEFQRPTQEGPYWALHQLQARYEEDQQETRLLKQLGYGQYIARPSPQNQRRLLDQMRKCCNALQPASRADSKIWNEIQVMKEWELAPGLTKQQESLAELLQRWHVDCNETHQTLKVTFPGKSTTTDKDVLGSYRICYSQAAPSSKKWYCSDLLLLESSTARENDEVDMGSKSIKLQASDHTAELEEWQGMRKICELSGYEHVPLCLRLNKSRLEHQKNKDSQQAPATSLFSFRQLLNAEHPFAIHRMPANQRTALAVVLCYTYLHLSDTDWWPTGEKSSDIFFAQEDLSNKLYAKPPFLNIPFQSTASQRTDAANFMNRFRPSLPMLGKFLLEIWKGTEVQWEHLHETMEECDNDYSGKYWVFAIKTCLGDDDRLKVPGSLKDTEQIRSEFVNSVVKSVQWVFEKSCRLNIADAFGTAGATVPERRISGSRNEQVGDGLLAEANGNSLCLHDGTGRKKADHEHISSANGWIDDLRETVHNIIPRDAPVSPVKVAIIDTGVSFDKRTKCIYQGRISGIRTWLNTSQAEGSEGSFDADSDGHGTHSLSTLLTIDPFCHVYVARVFEGREQKLGPEMERHSQQQVANAINYCVREWRVDIISMSFGYEERVDCINRAITDASAGNVVVLAAASNRGPPTQRDWPARHPTVISVHATDGYGNKYPRNPPPQDHEDNFATLGMEVEAWSGPDEKAYRSGTSIATPVAAGIASLVIRFLRVAKEDYLAFSHMTEREYDKLLEKLQGYAGMRRVFRHMAEDRDGYSYIQPGDVLRVHRGSFNDAVNELFKVIGGA